MMTVVIFPFGANCRAYSKATSPPSEWPMRISTSRPVALLISKIVGYEGTVVFDTSKPDGPPRKLLDVSLMKNIGWSPKVDFKQGLEVAFKDFLDQKKLGKLKGKSLHGNEK